MNIKSVICDLHIPKKIKSTKEDEVVNYLPPYALADSYMVDQYPGCPANWMHGSDITSSYFVPVEENQGMWLNFNKCFEHTHDVAIVISIQGVNPITGQKTDVLRLEKYETNCPVHNIPFEQDKFCPKCKYQWPDQNYLASTGTPNGLLWLDGFRTPDGKVRQYVFTSEEMKSIAKQIIGKDRVFAIGIAFYLSQKKKEIDKEIRMSRHVISDPVYHGLLNSHWYQYHYNHNYSDEIKHCSSGGGSTSSAGNLQQVSTPNKKMKGQSFTHMNLNLDEPMDGFDNSDESTESRNSVIGRHECACDIKVIDDTRDITAKRDKVSSVTPSKSLEIGAGALINQKVYLDPQDITYWQSKPLGMIYINYCDKTTCENILQKGKRKEKKDGFIEDLKTV